MTLILGVAAVGAAQSATNTTTASFQVTANLQAVCSASAAALNFNGYTPGGGALTASTNVVVKCSKSTGFTVSLNGGSGGGTVAQRLMLNGTANHLQYNLYTASNLLTIFGDGSGSGGSQTVNGTGLGTATANAVNVGVFGQLPDNAFNQGAVPGAYADTIAVTVSY
jgi:spore coat protein U-like protein